MTRAFALGLGLASASTGLIFAQGDALLNDWLTPTADLRLRAEFADIDGRDPSHMMSLRARLGIKTSAWNGLHAFVEGEFSEPLISDYHGGAPGARPFDPSNSTIGDPATRELNQAYLHYDLAPFSIRAGRQRIILGNAAMVGNVGWRMNEQTFDAVTLRYEDEPWAVQYSWIGQVNRVFGNDAVGTFKNVDSNVHLLDARGTIGETKVGSYLYWMDFKDGAVAGWDNQTLGLHAGQNLGGLDWYGEAAWQHDAGPANRDTAWYAHANVGKKVACHTFTFGIEHLDAGFKTPLATLHAFNGFADVFAGSRGNGTHGGLTDSYLRHDFDVSDSLRWSNTLHAFGDNSLATDRGWELDSVLKKQFNERLSALAKLAHFETESALPTTTRASLELNWIY